MSRNPRDRPRRARQALSHVGGRARAQGDPAVAAVLRAAATLPEHADPRALTHGFHAWPARMHPHTAAALIAACPEGAIADPFVGGGTVAVEGLLAGRAFFGGDVNPVGVEVAWARTRVWPNARIALLEGAAAAVVEEAQAFRRGKRIPDALWKSESPWFDPPALAEAWSIAEVLSRRVAGGDEAARLLRACLSSILIKASKQVSDSVPMLDKDHGWTPARRVETWFLARVHEHAGNLTALAQRAPAAAPEPRLAVADARRPPDDAVALAGVITSPPYPGVYDYAAHHERRYAMLGLDATLAREAEVGARREVRHAGVRPANDRYAAAMGAILGAWRERLLPTGRIFLVIGDGQEPKGAIPVLPLIERAARRSGCRIVATVSQRRPSVGPGHRGPRGAKEEHVVALAPGPA